MWPPIIGDLWCESCNLKSACGTKIYSDVMTIWLVELISVCRVYLRILVSQRFHWTCVTPHHSKRSSRIYRWLKGFCWFDLSRMKIALSRGVIMDVSCVNASKLIHQPSYTYDQESTYNVLFEVSCELQQKLSRHPRFHETLLTSHDHGVLDPRVHGVVRTSLDSLCAYG